MSLTKLQQLQALAAQNAAVATVNMAEVSKGGGGARRLLPQGFALVRFCRYIEFGKHAREYQGQAKTPMMNVRLGLALWGDTAPQTVYPADHAKAGQPMPQQERPDTLFHSYNDKGEQVPTILNSFDMTLGNNEKSKTKIAFDRMNYKGLAKSFPELLGEAFIVPILRKKGKAADAKEYNMIDWANLLPPFDAISQQPYQIAQVPDEQYQLFLWEMPTKETWDELFIDGKNEKTGKSKNFLQAKCIEALDFKGSPLEALLGGELPDLNVENDDADNNEAPPVPDAAATNAAAVPGLPGLPGALPDVPFDGGTPVATPSVPVTPAVPGLPAMPGLPAIG